MKMIAESGAFFGSDGNLPSDIENQSLKNVMEFEKAYTNAKPQKIFDILGKPSFEVKSVSMIKNLKLNLKSCKKY